MSIWRRTADAPEGHREEFGPDGAVVISLVEVGAEVVSLEIGEDVFDDEVAE